MRVAVAGLLAAALLQFAVGARCEDDPGVRAFVQHWEAMAKTIRSLAANDDAARSASCAQLTGEAFDFPAMLRDALPQAWAKLGGGQRDTLAAAIARKAASDCVDHIRDYDGGAFVLLGIRIAEDGTRLVTASVSSSNGRDVHVTWRLRAGVAAGWKAVDLIVEGRSMTATIRDEFSRTLARRGSLAAAIDTMARR